MHADGTNRRRPNRLLVGALAVLAVFGWLSRAEAQIVEVELVLAVDSSSSIDRNEFDQQMKGLAEAFRSPLVGAAVAALGEGGVAVTLIQWAGRSQQHESAPWRVLRSAEDAKTFADYLDATPRYVDGGSTAIGEALRASFASLLNSPYRGERLVIDISGDGVNNEGADPRGWRDRLIQAGVTVNALVILNEDPNLPYFYRTEVIGGPGAFLMTAVDYRSYGAAIEQKLLQELGPPQFVDRTPGKGAERWPEGGDSPSLHGRTGG